MLRKRIEIRLEHTEVTFSVTEVFAPKPAHSRTNPAEPPVPRYCPVCLTAWLPNLREQLEVLHLTTAQLELAVHNVRLHLFCPATDEVWVCERSIAELRDASSRPIPFADFKEK